MWGTVLLGCVLLTVEHTATAFKGLEVSVTVFYSLWAGSLWKLHVQVVLAEPQRVGTLKVRCASRRLPPTGHSRCARCRPVATALGLRRARRPSSGSKALGHRLASLCTRLPHFNFSKGDYVTTQEYFFPNCGQIEPCIGNYKYRLFFTFKSKELLFERKQHRL